MDDITTNYVARFNELGLTGSPATEREVIELERTFGPLPASYKAYLLIAGRSPPKAWVGSDCTLQYLRDLRGWADEMLRENGQPPLPKSAFVFHMHQGYQFFYFEADRQHDDPPVFYYHEGQPQIVRRFERFSDLVSVCAAGGWGT